MELPEEILEDARRRGKLRWADADGVHWQNRNGTLYMDPDLGRYKIPVEDLPKIEELMADPAARNLDIGNVRFTNRHMRRDLPGNRDQLHYGLFDGDPEPDRYFMSKGGLRQLQSVAAQPFDTKDL